jgi:uroporphyrinogen-III synthase
MDESHSEVAPPAPLVGVRVVVTRAAHQATGLVRAFAEAGAEVETLPLLEVVPPADPEPLARAASNIATYQWIVFTSANAVDAFLPRLAGSPAEALAGAGPRVAAVGDATAGALRRFGVEPALLPARSDAEGLVEALVEALSGHPPRILLPQAADARPTLAAGLAAAGAEVTVAVAYDKRLPPGAPERARRIFGAAGALGWVTFTSPRVVEHFAALFGDAWDARRATLRAASIGPVTSRALAAAGIEPAAEARTPGDAGLVAAVVAAETDR